MSRVLIMAGGTGGHVVPGLAVAQVLRNRGAEVSWLGTATGIEATLVPAARIPLQTIVSRGLRGNGWAGIVLSPFMLVRSVWQAALVLRRLRPEVVLGMGGYAAGPGGVAAWLLRVPLVLHEQNRVIGLTNRLLRPLARVMLYGFPMSEGSAKPSAKNIIGNPVNQAVAAASPINVTKSAPIRLLILGGSQGARALNRVVVEFARDHVSAGGYEIWHQCGRKLLAETRSFYGDGSPSDPEWSDEWPDVRLDGFIDDMAAAYSWADVVIARAGALTISELCVAQKPSILIPLPTAVGDHQTANAEYLTEHQAALLLPQSQLDVSRLKAAIESLASAERREAMGLAAAKLARPDAAQRLAEICLEWCDA